MCNISRRPKFPGFNDFPLKGKNSFSSNKRTLFPSSVQKKEEFVGLKAEAEKRGLNQSVELKFCRLEKRKEGVFPRHLNRQEKELMIDWAASNGKPVRQSPDCEARYGTTMFK